MPTGRIHRRRRALPRAAYILTTAALLAGSATGVYGAMELQAMHAAHHQHHVAAVVKSAPESHTNVAGVMPR